MSEVVKNFNGEVIGEFADETEKEEFVIDDASKAMWAISKVKEARAERDYYINACKNEIERLKEKVAKAEEKCESSTNYLMFKLNEYMDREDVPTKTTKTQTSLKLPNGKVVRKLAKEEICDYNGNSGSKLKTNSDLIDFADEKYRKVTVELDWAEFKKNLEIQDGVVITKDGEVVDCLTTREVPFSIDVKFEED